MVAAAPPPSASPAGSKSSAGAPSVAGASALFAGASASAGSAGSAFLPAGAGAGAGASALPMAGAAGMAGLPLAGAAGQATAGAASLPVVPVDKLNWATCDRTYQCATLKAPIDYANPSAGTLELALKRRVARGQRIGSMLINPGGPGGSGIDFLSQFLAGQGASLNQRFDVVSWDPRGVGQSTPLNCHSKLLQLVAADPSPDDDAEWTALDSVSKQFADECGMKHAALLPHLGTWDVARDLDRIREALGDDKLNFLGFSYGTAIGSYYAELFPDKIRAMVLDGALDNSLSAIDLAFAQGEGFELALKNYFTWCKGSTSRCSWANGQPEAQFDKIAQSVETKPLMASRPVGPGEFALGVIFPLYAGEQGWTILSSALREASMGQGATLLDMVDGYLERQPDGSYSNIQDVNNAVNCLDRPVPDYMGVRAEAPRFTQAAPHFGMASLTSMLVCSHWPVQGPPFSVPKGHGAAPIVVVGTTGDPATPYAWAEQMAKQLESGVLLTNVGEGHTAYGRGDACIDRAVEAYFNMGTVPMDGTRCTAGAAALAPPSMMMLRLMR
jgi:pimeloyl-ACP methyl ester carboxylesterase